MRWAAGRSVLRLVGLLLIALLTIAALLLLVAIAAAVLTLILGQDLGGTIGQVIIVPLFTLVALALALTTVGSTAVYVGLLQGRESLPGIADIFG